ncbi:hypothetical protein, partial [Actinomycetospora chlora]|uniref:hypothetical protein n=1 Tax=Actinomycetospora chlora TaxID=663608 RepID=UPI0031EB8C52
MSADAADTEQSGRHGPLPTRDPTSRVIPAPRAGQPAADVIPIQRAADDVAPRAARRSRPRAEVDLPAPIPTVDPAEAEEFLR